MSKLTNKLLPTIEVNTGSLPAYTIIWMHGLGADGNDFVPIVKELALPQNLSIRFLFPHAPERPVTINNGYIMRAWYDISHPEIGQHHDEIGLKESQFAIDTIIEKELVKGIAAKNIFLAGFSQGGAMALQAGLRQQNRLGGIIALSCYLPLTDSLKDEASLVNLSVPIFMVHGTHDDVIPLSRAIASRDHLLTQHYDVEWHEYPMAHSVCPQEILDLSCWLQRIIK